ncbi:MAG: MBL fold metallo-hydrolase [Clostridia bacterium]|nr:MBL fold metallo-hydrolase [Clostridia bacterium]MBO7250782.1 MBL fold metallo-hydrolase [Clostridia bacterium]
MKIVTLYPATFAANTHLLISDGHALVVDPAANADLIISRAEEEGVTIDGILLTHGHFDHIFSLDSLRGRLGIDAMMHIADAEMLSDGEKNASYTFFGRDSVYRPTEVTFEDGYEIPLGQERIKAIHTPGHSKGSVCYLSGDAMITGDTLFADGIGRSDLFGGNGGELMRSLDKLSTLDKNIRIYTGHGPSELLGRALDNTIYYRY